MSALLTKLLGFLFDKVVTLIGKLAAYLFENYKFAKDTDKKVEELKEAGTKPELTPEQKAKEIEDAFHKLNSSSKP